jgi:pyruvate formate lyase activating enzyme
MKEARIYQVLENQKIRCQTCAHYCLLVPGKSGICGVMQNREGVLYNLVYGRVIALHVDPIEKKPLFHFLPGAQALSIATTGCNMKCANCQNADISQMPRDTGTIQGQDMIPDRIIEKAVRQHCEVMAYTYTEPAIYLDYAIDIATLAAEKRIMNIFITNGYLSKESLAAVSPFLNGANIDLKAFKDETYKSVCGARLSPVLDTIERMHSQGIWVEITTLLIPGMNDSRDELKQIAKFIVELDPGIPWHISRFYPTYRMTDRPPTSPASIQKAREIGLEAGIRYVYSGNLPGDPGENTFCHHCGQRLVHRIGYQIRENRIQSGTCPDCQTKIPGVWIIAK